MSVSEILDNGANHTWANLKINSCAFSNTNPSAINYYTENLTINLVITGAISVASYPCQISRIGNIVTLYLPLVVGTHIANDYIYMSGLPADFYPLNASNDFLVSVSAPTNQLGQISISDAGAIRVYPDFTALPDNFNSAGTIGLNHYATIVYVGI